MSFMENLGWRYATKEFSGEKLPAAVFNKILAAIRFAPSSFGIQPYHITIIEGDGPKKELIACAPRNQRQISTCSHLLVFSADIDAKKRAADFVAVARKEGRTDIADDPKRDYAERASAFAEKMGAEWAAKQAYLALGFALAACTELKVDSCPMEAAGFTSIKEALHLPDNLEPKVLLAIGYRSKNDGHAARKKIRFGDEDLFDVRS